MIKLKLNIVFMIVWNSIIYFLILINVSCRPNDEEDTEPPRDYLEQSLEDDQLITQYLKWYYFNYNDFNTTSEDNKEIIIDTITSVNSNFKSLYDLLSKLPFL